MLKVYIAGRYAEKRRLTQLAEQLREMGTQVTSTWLEEPHAPDTKLKDLAKGLSATYAAKDLEDIERADVLIFFSEDPDTATVRGGRHVEFGYALAIKRPILVVGPLENIFHYLPQIQRVHEWKEAKTWLRNRAKLSP